MLTCRVLTKKIAANKTKNLLVENEFKKLKNFSFELFYWEESLWRRWDYLVFQSLNKCFKVIANTDYVSSWKSKGPSAKTIKPSTTSDNSLTPVSNYYGTKTRVKFIGSCLQQLRRYTLMEK